MNKASKEEANTKEHGKKQGESFSIPCFEAIVWWAMLIAAVLAVPALAIIISVSLPISDTAKIISFVMCCWACTWLGMWLMRKADLQEMNKDKE